MNRHVIDMDDVIEERSPVVNAYLFDTGGENEALGLRFITERHGGFIRFLSYQELAKLLDREGIARLEDAMRRNARADSPDSLNELGQENRTTDDYVSLGQ